jgi:Transcriptional regulator PadR-like family
MGPLLSPCSRSILLQVKQRRRRAFRPEDVFRVQRVGAVVWSPDGRYAAIELTRFGEWLDTIPNNDIALLDVGAQIIRPLTSPAAAYVALHRWEERQWLEAQWGLSENNRNAKYYQPTREGRKQLAARTATWSRYATAVSRILHTA